MIFAEDTGPALATITATFANRRVRGVALERASNEPEYAVKVQLPTVVNRGLTEHDGVLNVHVHRQSWSSVCRLQAVSESGGEQCAFCLSFNNKAVGQTCSIAVPFTLLTDYISFTPAHQ
jgi:hypothetical protein